MSRVKLVRKNEGGRGCRGGGCVTQEKTVSNINSDRNGQMARNFRQVQRDGEKNL